MYFSSCVSLSQVQSLQEVANKLELKNKVLGRAGDWLPVVSDWMIDILREGLGKRIELLCAKPQPALEVCW